MDFSFILLGSEFQALYFIWSLSECPSGQAWAKTQSWVTYVEVRGWGGRRMVGYLDTDQIDGGLTAL